jgi:hemoglobin
MKNRVMIGIMMMVVLAIFPILSIAGDHPEPSVDEQMAGLVGMCDASTAARAERQDAEPLYDRLGGYDKILALTNEIVRLHQINPDFRLMMKYVDGEHLGKQVADFMAAGTGGSETYKGRNMKDAHAHMEMTTGDFLSAGGDVMQAMKNLGHGPEEIDEVVCILVSMSDQVILK